MDRQSTAWVARPPETPAVRAEGGTRRRGRPADRRDPARDGRTGGGR
ncbi:hypothetical protein [Streptosporangium roseum]